jgi:hypothetical protein
MILGLCAAACLVILTLRELWITGLGAVALRFLRRRSEPRPTGDAPTRIVVLLPALREQGLVKDTLSWYAQLSYPRSALDVVVVTTAREGHEWESRREAALARAEAATGPDELEQALVGVVPRTERQALAARGTPTRDEIVRAVDAVRSTEELARELVDELDEAGQGPGFHVVNYPKVDGRKGSQLNYAIEWAYQQLEVTEDTYFAVFDFDARPDLRTFRMLHATATGGDGAPAFVQQVQVPLLTRDRAARRLLIQGFTLFAARRALGVEVGRILLLRLARRLPAVLAPLLRPMVYGIGSGMFLRAGSLGRLGTFPEPHDDLAIGYRASLLGERIAVLPSFNLVEPYGSVRQLTEGMSWVCLGSVRVGRELGHANTQGSPLSRPARAVLVGREWLDIVDWLLVPLLWIGSAAVLLAGAAGTAGRVAAIGALLAVFPAMTLLVERWRRRLVDDFKGTVPTESATSWPRRIALAATAPVHPVLNALGPLWLAYRYVASRGNLRFGKTER